ncbi:hypothetical protein AVEN_165103-1 [Araneus ventricosus]|uniref:Uncharacterized protein n=1 Tax=Araneus ventricosus TaxID=182803 RepID=A0A4Y2QGU4_ARAVE|nr:hypothetical protein AVEN_165103-1 [Araneus ventricosus]
MHFCHRSYNDVDHKPHLDPSRSCLRCYISSELENCYLFRKFFIRGKSHMVQDQGNTLIPEEPEYDVFIGNLTPGGICDPEPNSDGAPMT